MTDHTQQPNATPGTDGHRSGVVHALPYADIATLAQSTSRIQEFLGGALRAIARYFGSPFAAIHVQFSAEVVSDDCHAGPSDPAFWKPNIEDLITDTLTEPRTHARVLRSRTDDTVVALLAAPVVDVNQEPIGAVALVIAPARDEDISGQLAHLLALTEYTGFMAKSVGTVGAAQTAASDQTRASRASTDRAVARAAAHGTMEELAFTITNDLRNKLSCEQVALGRVVRRRIRLVSISGLDTIPHRSPSASRIASAMEECLDAGTPLVAQAENAWSGGAAPSGYRLHNQWREHAKGDAVVSMPLRRDDEISFVLSLRRRGNQPFAQGEIEQIHSRVEPFAAALELLRRANRGLTRHTFESVRNLFSLLTGHGAWSAKAAALLILVVSGWFCFGTAAYTVTVPCAVTPTTIRHLAAPYDGVLESAAVVQGDFVQAGDPLCQLDTRDLLQQQAELQSQLLVLIRQEDGARAANEPVEVRLAAAQQELIRARLDIVKSRLSRATVRAPVDGMVITGDLRRQVGSIVAQGQPLFDVAPLREWTLELVIPESGSIDIEPGLSGTFAATAQPAERHTFTVRRLRAAAETREGRNVLVAEANLASKAVWLRPGMGGVASIDVGKRPVWWILLHRAIDYVRLRLFI